MLTTYDSNEHTKSTTYLLASKNEKQWNPIESINKLSSVRLEFECCQLSRTIYKALSHQHKTIERAKNYKLPIFETCSIRQKPCKLQK
jgi:hypothetical protein